MSYSKLLNKVISNTDYTQEEIAQKCKELGVSISREKVNALQNNRSKPPKAEISRAIAKVCGIDERLLVAEGYFENAPEEVKEMLKSIQTFINTIALLISTKLCNLNDKDIDTIERYFENEAISETLVQIMDERENSIELLKDNLNYSESILGTTINFELPSGITIEDNGMFPLIEEKNKIILEIHDKYNTSDIVAYKTKDNNTIKARTLSKVNSTFEMIPLNKKYNLEIYSQDDIIILGKIAQVIKDI